MKLQLVSRQGYYEKRGGVVWAIAQLMELNDQIFDIERGVPPAAGICLDFQAIHSELSRMIEELRIVMDSADCGVCGRDVASCTCDFGVKENASEKVEVKESGK